MAAQHPFKVPGPGSTPGAPTKCKYVINPVEVT